MSLAGNFRRTVDVWVADAVSGQTVRAWLADEAKRNITQLVTSGRASRFYRSFTNGQEDADPRTVLLDGTGSISALFSRMSEAMPYALDYAIRSSPRESGRYVSNWLWLINGQPWTGTDYTSIPLGAEVVLTNTSDYHRKIDVGGMRMRVAPQIIERVRQGVMRNYPGIVAERKFIIIPGGYILKGRAIRSGLSWDKKTKKYFRKHPPHLTNRADSRKGEPMTYPSLFLSEPI